MPIVTIDEFLKAEGLDFDYLIVGGGTTGLAVAARLSENKQLTVGVLEAGAYHGSGIPGLEVPGLMGQLLSNSTYDWSLRTVPQSYANGREIPQPRGKGLGGSSLLNYLVVQRPSKEEYDSLEESFGNNGWNWESLLKCMKKSEDVYPPDVPNESKEYCGSGGPIKIARSVNMGISSLNKYLEAVKQLGISRNFNPLSGNNVGSSDAYFTVDSSTRTRSTSATGYLQPIIEQRTNLWVVSNVQVLKVLLESDKCGKQRAFGVIVDHNGKEVVIKNVRGDIILSSGTYNTPHLLEHSGIGNASILKKHGIECVIDLPGIGENLQDHVNIPIVVEIDNKIITREILNDPQELKRQQDIYAEKREGLLANSLAQGFALLPAHRLFENEAEMKTWLEIANKESATRLSQHTDITPAITKGLETQYSLYERYFRNKNHSQAELIQYLGFQPLLAGDRPEACKRYLTLQTVLFHSLSRGTVHITSADPRTPPAIDPRFLSRPEDVDMLVRCMEFSLKLCRTGDYKKDVLRIVAPKMEIEEMEKLSKEELKEILRNHARSFVKCVFHPTGTAAMMPQDAGGVVDSELKVYGTSNLRVVDLSVIPMALSCHTVSAAYVVGEKAAEILLSHS